MLTLGRESDILCVVEVKYTLALADIYRNPKTPRDTLSVLQKKKRPKAKVTKRTKPHIQVNNGVAKDMHIHSFCWVVRL